MHYQKIDRLGYRILDNACPRVKFVQRIVSDASKKGMDVILVGDKNHSQTNEIIGWIKTRVILIKLVNVDLSITSYLQTICYQWKVNKGVFRL